MARLTRQTRSGHTRAVTTCSTMSPMTNAWATPSRATNKNEATRMNCQIPKRTGMGTFRITVEIADPRGERFEAVEMLVETGATFTKAPRDLLERLGVPVEGTYTAELANGSRVERTRAGP